VTQEAPNALPAPRGPKDGGVNESSGTAPLWDAAYGQGDRTHSWFEPHAEQSLRLLDRCGVGPSRGRLSPCAVTPLVAP
jgi:hypothetical protein